MIIKNLALKNFRKFKNTYIEFPDGVTGVTGFNGVGKSTIFEAIAWALYGPSAARTSSDQIKRDGASDSESCRVELEFIFEEDVYRIVREMSGKNLTAQASATVNGHQACNGAETVARYIQKKLGMDFKSFFTSIFAKQNELNALSTMNASERRPLVLKMLGVDSLDEVIKEIRSDKKNKEAIVEKLQQELFDEKGENKIDVFKIQKKELETKKKKVVEILENQKTEIKNFEKNVKETQQRCLQIRKQYEQLDKEKDQLENQKNLYEERKKYSEEIKQIREKIQKRQEEIKKHRSQTQKFGDTEKELKKTEGKIKQIQNQKDEHVKKIEQKNTLMQRLKKDINEIDYKTRRIKKLGPAAICPTCERKLADHYDELLKKFESDKKKKEDEIHVYLQNITKIKEQNEQTSRVHNALNKKMFYFQKQQLDKEKIEATIEHITNELKREEKELSDKEKILNNLGKIDFKAEKYDKIKNQIKNVYKNHQEKLDFLNKQKDKLSQMFLNHEKKQGEQKIIEKDLKNFDKQIQQLTDYKKRVKNEKTYAQNLKMLSELMSSFRTHLISRIRPTLSLYASDFFRQLTDGKYSEVELDEKYNLMVYDNGKKYGIERFSGGEEDLANLCLRLAISEVIIERAGGIFNFIVLDEIFGSQDSIRRQNIINALSSLSSKYRQIFLITHVEDIKNDMENVINVYENMDETSQVKIE